MFVIGPVHHRWVGLPPSQELCRVMTHTAVASHHLWFRCSQVNVYLLGPWTPARQHLRFFKVHSQCCWTDWKLLSSRLQFSYQSWCLQYLSNLKWTKSSSSFKAWKNYLHLQSLPALVETFPPMWQDPLAPRSSGIMKPLSFTYFVNVSKMHPAWHTSAPLTCS